MSIGRVTSRTCWRRWALFRLGGAPSEFVVEGKLSQDDQACGKQSTDSGAPNTQLVVEATPLRSWEERSPSGVPKDLTQVLESTWQLLKLRSGGSPRVPRRSHQSVVVGGDTPSEVLGGILRLESWPPPQPVSLGQSDVARAGNMHGQLVVSKDSAEEL